MVPVVPYVRRSWNKDCSRIYSHDQQWFVTIMIIPQVFSPIKITQCFQVTWSMVISNFSAGRLADIWGFPQPGGANHPLIFFHHKPSILEYLYHHLHPLMETPISRRGLTTVLALRGPGHMTNHFAAGLGGGVLLQRPCHFGWWINKSSQGVCYDDFMKYLYGLPDCYSMLFLSWPVWVINTWVNQYSVIISDYSC